MTWAGLPLIKQRIDHVARQDADRVGLMPVGSGRRQDSQRRVCPVPDAARRSRAHVLAPRRRAHRRDCRLDDSGKIIGGQVWQICDEIERLSIPRVTIETNGVGTHAPNLLRGALKARRLRAGVADKHTTGAKNPKILGRSRAPVGRLPGRMCRCSMRSRNKCEAGTRPQQQPDDFLDAAAEAILDEPVRVGRKMDGNSHPASRTIGAQTAGSTK